MALAYRIARRHRFVCAFKCSWSSRAFIFAALRRFSLQAPSHKFDTLDDVQIFRIGLLAAVSYLVDPRF